MSRPFFILALFATLAAGLTLAATSAPTSRPAPAETPAASWDKYQIITTRNIFLRDRSPRYRSSGYSRPVRPVSDEDSIVLTGIVQQGLECVAFFENTRTNETMRLLVGQSLGGGTLAWICLESIGYRSAGGTRTITVGQALSGEIASLSSPPSSTGSSDGRTPASNPTSRPASGPADGDNTGDQTGDAAAPTSRPAEAASKPADSATTTPPEATGGSTDSIEQQMKKRRQQELNR